MNKWQQSIRNHFVNYLGFPKDLLLNLPKITLIGNEQIYIENHDGLISYQSHELIIQTQIGNLKITGSSLSIQELLPSELLMEGEVEEISYVNRGVL
ncbi:MAG TPA: sporulation protein YqfC [Bacillota bacterium]|nr:sporulation protein YqfC [Bacillota bacterium]